jgi:hypothetical protein
MTAQSDDLADAFITALDPSALRELASRLRPYLTEDPDRLLDAEEKAKQVGLHPESLVRMAREGRIPGARKVGREWRFPPGQCEVLPLVAPVTPDAPTRAPRRRPHSPRRSVSAIRGR